MKAKHTTMSFFSVDSRSRAYLNDSVLDTLVLDMIVSSVTSAVSLIAQCKAKLKLRLSIW